MSVEYNPMGACFNLYLQNLFTFEDILKTRQNQINEVLAEINNNQLLNYNFHPYIEYLFRLNQKPHK